jgi:8-oxo-dGTP pyrophosphatase MutT (NUDIX family)
LAKEGALEEARLNPDFLRKRFAQPLEWHVEMRGDLQDSSRAELTAAAILLPIVLRDQGLTVLLTRRAAHLKHHPGQISFPGGRVESYDLSHVDAALREAQEEIGLLAQSVEVIGQLPSYRTVSAYQITPVVGLIAPDLTVTLDANEVDAVFEVPLSFLMNADHHQLHAYQASPQSEIRHFYSMPYQDFFIWGATAALLRNLFHLLRA